MLFDYLASHKTKLSETIIKLKQINFESIPNSSLVVCQTINQELQLYHPKQIQKHSGENNIAALYSTYQYVPGSMAVNRDVLLRCLSNCLKFYKFVLK